MKVEENKLQSEIEIVRARIPSSDDLEIRVKFTNMAPEMLRLNGMLLDLGMVLLSFRKADGTPILKGPPPVPPFDDGKIGRVDIPPDGSVEYVYMGGDILGAPLVQGDYEVKFLYENSSFRNGEWAGTIESDWLAFEIRESED